MLELRASFPRYLLVSNGAVGRGGHEEGASDGAMRGRGAVEWEGRGSDIRVKLIMGVDGEVRVAYIGSFFADLVWKLATIDAPFMRQRKDF